MKLMINMSELNKLRSIHYLFKQMITLNLTFSILFKIHRPMP
ncbi:hypothetical protein [Shewanella woodyi]